MRVYPRVYTMLKGAGHAPSKAIEIIIDARRGDRFAIKWIRTLRAGRWGH